jgi:hypothetical protein
MSRSQFIAIVAVILIAGLLISGVLVYMNIIKQQSEKVEFLHNTDEKTVYYKGFGYSIEINYDGKFQVSRLIAKEHNILAPGRGIYLSYETKDHSFSSLNLDADPGIEIEEIDEENYAAVLNFEEENTQYEVRLDFTPYETKATIKRTIKNEISITHQGFPSINLEQDAVENIRWHRSGSNFWIAGKASNMRNFLSAGAGYLAEKGEAGFERGNVHRGVEDITFSLISSPDKKYAFRFDGSTDRDYATCVRRYEDGEFKHLEMNVTIAAPDKELRYLGHEDGWGSYSGRTVAQDAKIYRPVKMLGGQVDVVEFFIRPADYNQYFELGKLKGFDQELLSYALNNYGRLMIMDHDMGTAVESPNHFLELPALEQHWNTCIVGLFMDDAALESQKNGLKVIRDKLQALDGHITSPYPWITHDNWGSKYSDMMPGYVLANIYLYNLTGDKEFFDSMVESCIKALESQEKMYLDGKVWLCKNLVTENELNMNDYWEHTAGMYNGYTSAMYYETLVKFSTLLEALYGNQYADLVNHYLNLAEKIKEDFNRLMWSDNTNTFLYGSDNLDILYLPVQGAAIRGGIVDKDRIKLMVESVERYTAVFDLPFHVMNVLDILNENRPADQSDDYNKSMLGMNGGWYGAPDGDFYSGFPIYGDRSLIPRYINRFTELFEKTGFVGATAYKRDGVTPADYGWYDSMPTLVHPIWGLYTYGYGFQPLHDRLNIAPFIHESMAGSVVKYRFRQVDMEITYKSLYEFELVAMDDPKTPIYFQFINQTPNKEYEVVINGKTQKYTADAEGTVSVQVEGRKTSVKLVAPDDEEMNITSLKGKPVIVSSTKNGDRATTHWSTCLTDGEHDLYWVPRADDEKPHAIVALGGKAKLSTIVIRLKEEAGLKYFIEGTNDPKLKDWKVIVDNSKKATSGTTLEHDLKGAYHYIRIRFVDAYPEDIMITEIETR